MSVEKIAKSDTDLSSSSSWSVIDETDDSRKSSVENIPESDSDKQNLAPTVDTGKETDDTFIDIPEVVNNVVVDVPENDESKPEFYFDELPINVCDRTDGDGQDVPKGKRKKRHRAEPLSILSIAASVLTITGLTLLCMLFPQTIEDDSLAQVEANYISVVTSANPNFEDFVNKTQETLNIVNKTNLLETIKLTIGEETSNSDPMCPANERQQFPNETIQPTVDEAPQRINLILSSIPEDLEKYVMEPDKEDATDLIISFEKLQNRTMGLIRDLEKVLMNPNLQIFLCTLMQDICLIKLVKQLNKSQPEKTEDKDEATVEVAKVSTEKPKTKKLKKGTPVKRRFDGKPKEATKKKDGTKTKKIEGGKLLGDSSSRQIFISSVNATIRPNSPFTKQPQNPYRLKEDGKSGRENGKSECERRFEELDNKWETAGLNHRQKIQEIKKNFQNEVLHIKEQEKELSQRRRRINLIREKYIDRLRLDREKYLFQLHKLREEHHRIMRELCLKKSVDIDLKDASVGNYAVLLPDTYNFQQKLQLLRNRENKSHVDLPSVPLASYPKLDPAKSGSAFANYVSSFPNISVEAKKEKGVGAIQFKREKYIEKVKKYYDKKEKYLKKKAANLNRIAIDRLAKKVENFTENPFEDMVSHMITTISESKSRFNKSFSSSSMETVKGNITKEVVEAENIEDHAITEPVTVESAEFTTVTRKKQKKHDIYDVAFDENSKKIKQDDMMKWNFEKKKQQQQQQPLSKQDPQKAYKEKLLIKGHM